MKPKYRYQFYKRIFESIPDIHEEARQAAKDLGLEKVRGKIGLYPGSSTCPGPLPNYVLKPIIEVNRGPIIPLIKVEDDLREVSKDIYGDEYDVAVTNTCEAGLRLVYETLFAPPTMRKGEAYRGRFLTPYAEDFEFIAAYGRPFPPKYKGLFLDRSASAGELSVEGKSITNLDTVFIRLAGVKYEPHGIKFNPVALMTSLDHKASYERFVEAAARHASELVGITVVSYSTPGYGANEVDENNVPRLMKMLGALADQYDVPYIVDSAASVPVLSPSPKDYDADIMLWSADKTIRAPISGLIIGTEEIMVPIRKALGVGGERYGELSSHSKSLFSLSDPGRDAVIGLTAVLKILRDEPEKITRPIDDIFEILKEEFNSFKYSTFLKKMLFTKSYTTGGIEINYSQTWSQDKYGIPIFTMEDMFSNTNPIMSAMWKMGVIPATIYNGNMLIAPGLGTTDENGQLMEEPTRLAVKALVRATEIVCKFAGLKE